MSSAVPSGYLDGEPLGNALKMWQRYGVTFEIDEVGVRNVESGAILYEKRERIFMSGVPLFLMDSATLRQLQAQEDKLIAAIKEQQGNDPPTVGGSSKEQEGFESATVAGSFKEQQRDECDTVSHSSKDSAA